LQLDNCAYPFYFYLSVETQWLWILLRKSTSTNKFSNENSFDYVKKKNTTDQEIVN